MKLRPLRRGRSLEFQPDQTAAVTTKVTVRGRKDTTAQSSVNRPEEEPVMTMEHLDSGDILSQAVEHNGIVYVCGLTGDDLTADVQGQTEQVLKKIDDRLAKCGTDKSKLLMATVYLTDINQKPRMNEVWKAWLSPLKRPARACVGVTLGTPDTLVEIVVSAAK